MLETEQLLKGAGACHSASQSKEGYIGFGTSEHPIFMKPLPEDNLQHKILPLSCHEWQVMGPKEVFYSYLVPEMIW